MIRSVSVQCPFIILSIVVGFPKTVDCATGREQKVFLGCIPYMYRTVLWLHLTRDVQWCHVMSRTRNGVLSYSDSPGTIRGLSSHQACPPPPCRSIPGCHSNFDSPGTIRGLSSHQAYPSCQSIPGCHSNSDSPGTIRGLSSHQAYPPLSEYPWMS